METEPEPVGKIEKMIAAMVRLSDYEILGIIPEDLKRKPAQKEGAAPQTRSATG